MNTDSETDNASTYTSIDSPHDHTPTAGLIRSVVDEEGLPDGIRGGVGDALTSQSFTAARLNYDVGNDGVRSFTWHTAGLPALTSGGVPINWQLSGNGRSLEGFDDNGDRVIWILHGPATGPYYKLFVEGPLDHRSSRFEDDIKFTVGYTVTDGDGDSADGAVQIIIDDDSGIAHDDSATTASGTPVRVDVLANDEHGADGPGDVIRASVQGGAGVGSVTINPDSTLTFVPHQGFAGDAVIDYTGTDGDGDITSASLTVDVMAGREDGELFVGDNGDNHGSTGPGDDVLIGDLGGKQGLIASGVDYNISILIDESGSMRQPSGTDGLTRLQLLQQNVNLLLTRLAGHDGNVDVQVVRFDDKAHSPRAVDGLNEHNVAGLIAYVNGAAAQGSTNYQAALSAARKYHVAKEDEGDRSLTMFLTDGLPTSYREGGHIVESDVAGAFTPVHKAYQQFLQLGRLSEVHTFGIGEEVAGEPDPAGLLRKDYLDIFDNTETQGTRTITLQDGTEWTSPAGESVIVNTQEVLNAALAQGGPDAPLEVLGDDVLAGGVKADILFGDTVNSDHLRWRDGDTHESFAAGSHDGLGYEGLTEFLKWSVHHGNGAEASDAEIIAYIQDHYRELMDTDRVDGGNDTLLGEGGRDVLIGGGGDDVLIGGRGGDVMWGGFGADTFGYEAGDAGSVRRPAEDEIKDFTLGNTARNPEADRLDLSDLLDDARDHQVSDFLHASQEGDDTVIAVKSDGGIGAHGAGADQFIVLAGVRMGGASSDAFLDRLIDHGQLEVE